MAGNGTSSPYEHIDMTPEYNRIITALTGIRDDIRLLRRRAEDCEIGVVTNSVMNDLQRAMMTTSMSASGGNMAESVRQAIDSGNTANGGIGAPTAPAGEDGLTRAEILAALGQDAESTRTVIRVNGMYYFEAEATAGPDDGLRGSIPQVTPYTQGEYLGYHNWASNQPVTGSPAGPPDDIPHPSVTKKRWPATRPAGQTAVPTANPNADLIDPVTGDVIPKSLEDQVKDLTSGEAPPPAWETSDGTGVG